MKDITAIVSEQANRFLDSIKYIADRYKIHPIKSRFGGFPLFIDNNTLFYEQVALEERIENSIWRYLVNEVFKELFSVERCQSLNIDCEWKKMHPQLTTSYIEGIENRYPIEFVIVSDGKRTGYRYTNLYGMKEYISKVFDDARIDELVILDFSSPTLSTFVHENGIISSVHVKKNKANDHQ